MCSVDVLSSDTSLHVAVCQLGVTCPLLRSRALEVLGWGGRWRRRHAPFLLFPALLLTVLHSSYFIICLLEVGAKENSQTWEDSCCTQGVRSLASAMRPPRSVQV